MIRHLVLFKLNEGVQRDEAEVAGATPFRAVEVIEAAVETDHGRAGVVSRQVEGVFTVAGAEIDVDAAERCRPPGKRAGCGTRQRGRG